MRITLDNAQSGGPKINIMVDGQLVGTIYLRADNLDMMYWDFEPEGRADKLSDMKEIDDIVLYDDED